MQPKAWGFGLEAWGLGPWAWDLRPGTWDLGLGAWGLGPRLQESYDLNNKGSPLYGISFCKELSL